MAAAPPGAESAQRPPAHAAAATTSSGKQHAADTKLVMCSFLYHCWAWRHQVSQVLVCRAQLHTYRTHASCMCITPIPASWPVLTFAQGSDKITVSRCEEP